MPVGLHHSDVYISNTISARVRRSFHQNQIRYNVPVLSSFYTFGTATMPRLIGARRPVDFQVGLHNAVAEEGKSSSGRSW